MGNASADAPLSGQLQDWLHRHAESLDTRPDEAESLVPVLGALRLPRIGVPQDQGGDGGDVVDAIEAVARTAEESLAAAFVLWGQRAFIEYLLQSPNEALRSVWLPGLLDGSQAGATGLSNAMKFLSGIESLQISARPAEDGWILDGQMPWVTNLRRAGFVVAGAVARGDGLPPVIAALRHDLPGLLRTDDLDLMAMRGSNTAAVRIESVSIGKDALLHEDARLFLPRVRPAFLGLQCGMSIGLARASLRSARAQLRGSHAIVAPRIDAAEAELGTLGGELAAGLRDGRFIQKAGALFELRIGLAGLVREALNLELEASGGHAYLSGRVPGFARRWREAAFIPIVTPSLTQLQGELAKQRVAA